jgi:hypothetical protein
MASLEFDAALPVQLLALLARPFASDIVVAVAAPVLLPRTPIPLRLRLRPSLRRLRPSCSVVYRKSLQQRWHLCLVFSCQLHKPESQAISRMAFYNEGKTLKKHEKNYKLPS